MIDLTIKDNCLCKVVTDETIVEIPSNVTHIKSMSICNQNSMQILLLPSSILRVDKYAITNCKGLKIIKTYNVSEEKPIDTDVLSEMESGAIMNCEALENVELGINTRVINSLSIVSKQIKKCSLSGNIQKISTNFILSDNKLNIELPNTVEVIDFKVSNNSLSINNKFYKTINGIIYNKDYKLISTNNAETCQIDINCTGIALGSLRGYTKSVINNSKAVELNMGAIINNEIIDYYGEDLIIDRKIKTENFKGAEIKNLTIKSEENLSELYCKVKILTISKSVKIYTKDIENLEIKGIIYEDIRIDLNLVNKIATDINYINDDKYFNLFEILNNDENIEDSAIKFWLVYAEHYSQPLHKKLSKILIKSMERSMRECEIPEIEIKEMYKMLGVD